MTTRARRARALAMLAALSIASSAGAQGVTKDLFTDVGSKQTAKDFEPAPDTIDANFGTLQFTGGAFPTDASVQRIYDELDLQRATQAYMDFFPALSLYAIVKSQVRDFGFKTSSDLGVTADFMQPSENYLTGNDVTVEPPEGQEGNWLQTIPGKSWWIGLRMYGPLQPWIDKTWRPGEIELVE